MAASDAVQALRGRLGGARLLLEPQVGTGAHVALSKIQCRAVLSMLGSSTLSSDDRSVLVPLVMSAAFTDADATVLLEALANDGDGPGGSRRKSQDFTAFVNYFDEARWKRLLDASTLGEKEDLVIQLLRSLGLRLPSELTFKLMASFLLLISETWESASQRTLPDKKALLTRTKAAWRVGARTLAAPPVWFAKLPESPTEVLAKHRDLFTSTYGEGVIPLPPQVDMIRLHMVDNSFKCRAYDSGSFAPPPPNRAPNITNMPSPGNNMGQLEQFANMLMRGFAQMQEQQAKICEIVMCGNKGNEPRGLAALLDRPGAVAETHQRHGLGANTNPLNGTPRVSPFAGGAVHSDSPLGPRLQDDVGIGARLAVVGGELPPPPGGG